MKKISLLALATVFGLNLMAQKSNVVVFSEDGDSFYAYLNGVKQNTTAQSNVRITGIPGQAASLRIVFANSGYEPVKKNLMLDPTDMEHTIKLKKDKKGAIKMQYFGSVAIAQSTSTAPAMAYTATEVPANNATTVSNTGNTGTVDNSGTYTVNTQVNDMSGTQSVNTTSSSGTGTYSTNAQVSDPAMNGSTQTVTTTTTTNSSTTGTNGNDNVNLSIGVGANGMNMNVNVSGSGTGDMNSGNVSMNTGMNVNGSTTSSQTVTTTTTTTSSSSSGTYSNTTYNTTDPNANNATYNTNTTYNTTATTDPNVNNSNYNTTTYNNTTSTTSGGCFYAMDDVSFAKMKSSVEKVDFSDTRMSTAKTATRNNCLSTDQVKTIMDLFDMDDDKLEYAKFAYDYTMDKNNFYTLGEALDFDTNKNALNQFIESKR